MNLFVPTCLALLVILAGMHYMAKVKSENLGPFFKWIGYLVLLAAACVLFGLMFKGVKKIIRYGDGHHKEYRYQERGMHKGKRMMDGCGAMGGQGKKMSGMGMGNMDCGMGGGMQGGGCCCCCGDMGMMDHWRRGANMQSESVTDTVDGKIIRKETRIIEKEK